MAPNNDVCSDARIGQTDEGAIENAARSLGSRFVVGDTYLVEVPGAAAEQAVRDALAN